jgi:CcmD family protein
MSYLIAAYAVTFVTLLGYGWQLARERARLLNRQRRNTG